MPKRKDQQPQIDRELNYRTISMRMDASGQPASLNEETRSVEAVGATETPVLEYDWDRYEFVPTVLLMSGMRMPASKQIVLLDTHMRYSTANVIGSYRDMHVDGDELVGRAHYSSEEEADKTWLKTKEGHLTDFSVSYRGYKGEYAPEGETINVDGKTFDGPIRVMTDWEPKELSSCPIGADEFAKARAATNPPNPQNKTKKETEMDEKTRAFLESRGLSKTATEDEALRFLATLEVPRAGEEGLTAADVERMANEKTIAEINRREGIRSMCDHYGYGDLATEMIDGNKSLDEARSAVMKKHMGEESSGQNVGHRGEIVLGADAADKFRAAGTDSLLIRSGLDVKDPAAGARDLAGLTLRELARESLRMAGKPFGGDPMAMLGRALTTSDFPLLLAASSNKSLLTGFETAEETWPKWCATGSVSDFKTHTAVRAGETDDLDEIGEEDEYKYGNRSEQAESYSIATFGKLFSISRQTLINDDLGALVDIPMAHGEAWARKLGDLAVAVLTANSAMGDGTALFHANHGNIGGAGALSETTMADGIKKMKLQKDIGGKRRLNIQPRFLLAPVALEGSAEVFFGSNQFAGANSATTRANPYAGTKYERIYEARLDDDSALIWYLLGAKGKTVKLFFLNGNQLPTLESKQGWSVDGVEYKVRGDAGAKAMSWKAMLRNAGV